MAKNFAEIAFTDSVKAAQKEYGSREIYRKMEGRLPNQDQLGPREKRHIEHMDGFYMATLSESGWPYVQFRGGPKGFLKVLNAHTIGFADFRGNMQYISTGNINKTGKASLILMDYPTQTRLKLWVEAEIIHPEDAPELQKQLIVPGYRAQVERLFVLHVAAFDWNCPQHIPQRFTIEEFKEEIPKNPQLMKDCCPKLT